MPAHGGDAPTMAWPPAKPAADAHATAQTPGAPTPSYALQPGYRRVPSFAR
jgi:hypothetical protein